MTNGKNIIVQMRETEPHTYNMYKFLNEISKPYTQKMVRILNKRSLPYHALMNEFGLKSKSESGRFAYYLRHAKTVGFVKLDIKTKQYYLTFKGIKAFELLESIEKISNLSMSSPEDAQTKLLVDLNQNKGWLRPLIQSEIRLAVEQLTKRRKSIS